MNLTAIPRETYEQFYRRNVREVNGYTLTREPQQGSGEKLTIKGFMFSSTAWLLS